MEAQFIIDSLESTPYKFTKAEQFKKRLKALEEEERLQIIQDIKLRMWKIQCEELKLALGEIVFSLNE